MLNKNIPVGCIPPAFLIQVGGGGDPAQPPLDADPTGGRLPTPREQSDTRE